MASNSPYLFVKFHKLLQFIIIDIITLLSLLASSTELCAYYNVSYKLSYQLVCSVYTSVLHLCFTSIPILIIQYRNFNLSAFFKLLQLFFSNHKKNCISNNRGNTLSNKTPVETHQP